MKGKNDSMWHGIPPSDNTFNDDMRNELNTAIQLIEDKISEIKVKPLKYKYPVKRISINKVSDDFDIVDRTILIGRELIIDFDLTFKADRQLSVYDVLEIARIPQSVPYPLYGVISIDNKLKSYRFKAQEDLITASFGADNENGTLVKKDTIYHFWAHCVI